MPNGEMSDATTNHMYGVYEMTNIREHNKTILKDRTKITIYYEQFKYHELPVNELLLIPKDNVNDEIPDNQIELFAVQNYEQ